MFKKIERDFVEYYHIKINNWLSGDLIANGIRCETYYGMELYKEIKWICDENLCSFSIKKEL